MNSFRQCSGATVAVCFVFRVDSSSVAYNSVLQVRPVVYSARMAGSCPETDAKLYYLDPFACLRQLQGRGVRHHRDFESVSKQAYVDRLA